jgi:phosphate-selective porin
VNWYLSKSLRASIDYFHTSFDLKGTPARNAVIQNDEDALLTRLQVSF